MPGEAARTDSRVAGPGFSHRNNFDLIRLIAAAQVAVVHAAEHLSLRLPVHDVTIRVLESFPGVPIFFGVSGFLISASWQRSASRGEFFLNRALRIFPALWLCFALSVGLIAVSGYFATHPPQIAAAAIWAGTQLSFLQFYNPDFLRDWGIGAVNGSLWTIPVEMQFYLLTPLIVALFVRSRSLFWIVVAAFMVVNLAHTQILSAQLEWDGLRKLAAVTFAPWIYMFMLGAAANFCWSRIRSLIEGRFLFWLLAYAAIAIANLFVDLGAHSNHILPVFGVMLIGLTLSAAFTAPGTADRLLRRNDISYGLYIYHMPVYNFVLERFEDARPAAVWVLAAVFGISLASWLLIEKPALALKKHPLFSRR